MIQGLNILITGATGFIAYNLAVKLSAKNNVYCIVRTSSDTTKLAINKNIKLITYNGEIADLYQQLSAIKIDLTYHLASLFIAEHKMEQIDQLIDSNIKFSTQLVDVIVQLGCTNFVNTGTAWQHFNGNQYNPVCLYAASKQAFMDILEFYIQAKNLSVVNLKIYDTYGYGDERKKLFWLFKNLAKTNASADMPPGEQRLNLVYILDVITAFEQAGIMLLNKTNVVNQTYGIYADNDYSLKELAHYFETVTKSKLNLNWGVKSYRQREVMVPNTFLPKVPQWEAKIDILNGIKLLVKE
ncbi:MAG: NAD-dependent epimerase/dehydratase family protein [Burkholderiales bacterium]|nr:NAD-dependent epimerase/dehydratase family protein [Burkholderiales bacterium]